MLSLNSKSIAPESHIHLASIQQQINDELNFEAQVRRARSKWDNKTSGRGQLPFTDIKSVLLDACVGVKVCVYCEQNEATDIEHIFPKRLYPEKAFMWNNYVLACSNCNTHHKCDHFKIFNPAGSATGQDITPQKKVYIRPDNDDALFINQRLEDPMDYLTLNLTDKHKQFLFTIREEIYPVGTRGFSKAAYTIDILGLNTRQTLVKSRAIAAQFYLSWLGKYMAVEGANTLQGLAEAVKDDFGGVDQTADFTREKERIKVSIKNDITGYSHPTVWKEMIRQRWQLPRTNSYIQQVPEVLTW